MPKTEVSATKEDSLLVKNMTTDLVTEPSVNIERQPSTCQMKRSWTPLLLLGKKLFMREFCIMLETFCYIIKCEMRTSLKIFVSLTGHGTIAFKCATVPRVAGCVVSLA